MAKRYKADERRVLIQAVSEEGETVRSAATRLGVPPTTAYQWMAKARGESRRSPRFVEVVRASQARAMLRVRVGSAAVDVEAGFDAHLLREVVAALGGGA